MHLPLCLSPPPPAAFPFRFRAASLSFLVVFVFGPHAVLNVFSLSPPALCHGCHLRSSPHPGPPWLLSRVSGSALSVKGQVVSSVGCVATHTTVGSVVVAAGRQLRAVCGWWGLLCPSGTLLAKQVGGAWNWEASCSCRMPGLAPALPGTPGMLLLDVKPPQQRGAPGPGRVALGPTRPVQHSTRYALTRAAPVGPPVH